MKCSVNNNPITARYFTSLFEVSCSLIQLLNLRSLNIRWWCMTSLYSRTWRHHSQRSCIVRTQSLCGSNSIHRSRTAARAHIAYIIVLDQWMLQQPNLYGWEHLNKLIHYVIFELLDVTIETSMWSIYSKMSSICLSLINIAIITMIYCTVFSIWSDELFPPRYVIFFPLPLPIDDGTLGTPYLATTMNLIHSSRFVGMKVETTSMYHVQTKCADDRIKKKKKNMFVILPVWVMVSYIQLHTESETT